MAAPAVPLHGYRADIRSVLAEIDSSSSVAVGGELTDLLPIITVNGFGHVAFPLQDDHARRLASVCDVAPYGMGT